MKQKIKIILINLLLLFFVLFVIEIFIWNSENIKLRKENVFPPAMKYVKFHSGIKKFQFNTICFSSTETQCGRQPIILKKSKKPPLVIFGCSFAYGYNLNKDQTMSAKLSKLTKRSVFNRAWTGWGIQHMLYQAEHEEMYEQIPEPEYVIYVFIHDHIRRLYLISFGSWNILAEEFNLRYKLKDYELIQIQNSNPILNQLKRLYITNILHRLYVKKIILKPENTRDIYDFTVKHFTQAKQEMSKHWKKTKYAVFIYDYKNLKNYEYLTQELEKRGFKVITTYDLTDKDLGSSEYLTSDQHPKESAWDLLLPKLKKELNL